MLHTRSVARGDAAYLDDPKRPLGDRLVVHAGDGTTHRSEDELDEAAAVAPFCGPMRMLEARAVPAATGASADRLFL